MHVTSVVFLLATLGAYAAPAAKAEAEAEAEPWCWRPGQPCWKAKRAAEAKPKAEPWCWRPGQPCWKAKRAAEAKPEAVPWCWRPGEPCWKVKRAAEAFAESINTSGGLQERTPEAEYSNSPGGAAYKAKRSVHELANLAALTTRDPAKYYRDLGLENVFERDEAPITKRDTSGSPIALKDKRWCYRPGEPCWKVKRAADAVLNAIRDEPAAGGDTKGGDKADASNQEHHFPEYCDGPGILCYKKRSASPEPEPEASPKAAPWCWRPGEPCWKAKRDLHALQLAARAIVDSHE